MSLRCLDSGCLESGCLEVSESFLEGVWSVSRRHWRVSGECLEGDCKVSEGCLECVLKVSGGGKYMKGVWRCLKCV